ncbi:MAG: hypothetical protein JNL11_10505 [Bdellovibrionaceae bacterium]|nr:hypothetical protein [Pseudobdellovibrionaceae bacterium]
MKWISLWVVIIMMHCGFSALAMSSEDFNKEIEMLTQDQYTQHVATINQVRATEAAVDFENKYRRPSPAKSLVFFPLKLRPKLFGKPKTKVAVTTPPANSKVNSIQLYREQML